MSRFLKKLWFACSLGFALVPPATFAQEDSATIDYDAYEQEEYVNSDAEESAKIPFSEVTPPLPFRDRAIDATEWKRLTADETFNYTDEKPEIEKEPAGQDSGFLKFMSELFAFFRSGAGKVLIWILVAGIVLLIVFRIVKLNGNVLFARKDKQLNKRLDETADDYIPENWEQSIADAAQAGNYRLAVRHGYRYLLNVLQEQGKVRFETAKTNYQYAFELSGTRLHQPFIQLTRQYEYAWYGGFDIGKEQFEAYYRLLTETRRSL